jgi:cell division protein FtsZ
MPRIDELPIPAQNEIKAQRGELSADHPEKRRMSLMQRLASVGLGGRKDEAPQPPQTAHHQPMPSPMQMAKRPVRPAQRPSEGPVSEYARRPAPQGLDPHGRPQPVQNVSEDDQLEIPAFLRRQAN